MKNVWKTLQVGSLRITKICGVVAIAETENGDFIFANSTVGYSMIGALERMKLDILDMIYREL